VGNLGDRVNDHFGPRRFAIRVGQPDKHRARVPLNCQVVQ
jgi:hypothetical protein